ncbi:MAG: EcsC family protein [Propionibacteriaceae bacterium]|nr:EcsC family protein [Propionibacteriaceae bacterium]
MTGNRDAVAVTEMTADAFHQMLEIAIEGRGKLPGARRSARSALERLRDPEAAVAQVANQHILMAGGQGFATNWGGFLLALVTIPANLAASLFVQARAVAAIAHLRGYELNDPRVRTAILMVMLGPRAAERLIRSGQLPSSPAAVATAPVFDARLDERVSRALFEITMNQISGKRLGVFLGKKIPFVGGGVGAVVDGWSTNAVVRHAMREFVSRRPRIAPYAEAVE